MTDRQPSETEDPVTQLDERFGDPSATQAPWHEGRRRLADAELSWLTTVRADGRPHVTPLLTVWLDEALYFCTGPGEQKAKNVRANPSCIITTGTNALHEGLDVVLEGTAVEVNDEHELRRLAAAYEAKYGKGWHFDVRDGAFLGDAGPAIVFEVAPVTVFGFAKAPYAQTRWRFQHRRRGG